ncbi:MAG: molybdenum cofactor biosynthesis protein MoaE [Euryarchaeota archaeon]|nr:molybdenum cofactor biosynthesis protein MoaE [Euryarchaeota archaeon]|tara:strand:+ start:3286 stop:3717 length:432 start_codon:yes stop_codon:yes gene_type:complete
MSTPFEVIVDTPSARLEPDALLQRLPVDGVGAVVSFVGLTRGTEGDAKVLRLEFDAWQEQLPKVLHDLAVQAGETHGLRAVAIAHRIGSVEPEEPIVAIHVGSAHRGAAFEACRWLIDELKQQAPLWKKEVTDHGATWKAGLG